MSRLSLSQTLSQIALLLCLLSINSLSLAASGRHPKFPGHFRVEPGHLSEAKLPEVSPTFKRSNLETERATELRTRHWQDADVVQFTVQHPDYSEPVTLYVPRGKGLDIQSLIAGGPAAGGGYHLPLGRDELQQLVRWSDQYRSSISQQVDQQVFDELKAPTQNQLSSNVSTRAIARNQVVALEALAKGLKRSLIVRSQYGAPELTENQIRELQIPDRKGPFEGRPPLDSDNTMIAKHGNYKLADLYVRILQIADPDKRIRFMEDLKILKHDALKAEVMPESKDKAHELSRARKAYDDKWNEIAKFVEDAPKLRAEDVASHQALEQYSNGPKSRIAIPPRTTPVR